MQTPAVSGFQVSLANLLKARFPYLYIATWEEQRLLGEIRSVAQNEALIRTRRTVFTWSLTTGLVREPERRVEVPPTRENPFLQVLDFAEKCQEAALFVLKDFHIYFGGHGRAADPQAVRKVRDILPALKQGGYLKSVIFVSPTLTLPTDLQKDVTIVDYDLPTVDEIRTVLDTFIATIRNNPRITIDLGADGAERLSRAALGLSLHEAENAFSRAVVKTSRLDLGTVDVIVEEKSQIIKKTEILEYIRSDRTMDSIGGLENLKRWLAKRNRSWLPAAQRYALAPPKGVLITGVPGCGKSLTAKAVGAAWQLPLLRLDVGKIFSGLVGSSEENMRRAIQTAEATAPSILWIDEIEKGFSNTSRTNDGGTSTRVFATFLTWMQEKTKPVFVIATSNNIHALPPELLRKGRFDEIFFVDLPTHRERKEIFRVHLRRLPNDPHVLGTFRVTDVGLDSLAQLTEGFIGAEIEQVITAALFEAFADNRSITFGDFRKAIENTVPLAKTQAEQIRAIREWADNRAVAATAPDDVKATNTTTRLAPEDVASRRGGRLIDI